MEKVLKSKYFNHIQNSRKVIITISCFLILSCESGESTSLMVFEQPNGQINSNLFIPNSYVFDQVPQAFGNGYVYLDKSVGSIIFLSADFSFSHSQLVQGNGPNLLNTVYSLSIVENQIFVLANDKIGIFDQDSNQFNVTDWPFRLDDWVSKWNGAYIVGHVLPDSNEYYISTFQIDSMAKVSNVQHKIQIPFPTEIDYLEYTGYCLPFNDYIIFVKDWHGEIFKINAQYELVENRKLPYSGPEHLLFEAFEGEKMSQFFQAYSAIKLGDNFAVLRELDFEEGQIDNLSEVNEKYLRKKIHVFNAELDLIKSIRIPEHATHISYDYKNQFLFTLHGSDEKVFYYHLPLSLLK